MQGSYLGKDGKLYSTIEKKWEADARYEQHQEQKSLLEEQNRLLAQQNSVNSQLEMKKLENERLRILAEKSSQYEQMEHEENMRIFKLCDEVGIPKETLDSFREYLFALPEEVQSIENKQGYVKNIIEKVNTAESYLKSDDEDIIKAYGDLFPNLDEMKKKLTAKQEEKIEGQFEEWCNNPTEYKDELIRFGVYNDLLRLEKEKSKKNKPKIFTLICFLITLFTIIYVCALGDKYWSDTIFIILIVIGPTSMLGVFYGLWKIFTCGDSEPTIQENIDSILTNLKYYKTLKVNKIEPKKYLKNYIKDLENQLNDYGAAEKKFINNLHMKWNDFTDFRKNHYNSKVEKLLIDVGFKDIISEFNAATNLGLKYPKINVNNKIKDGSVEDYIAYFDELQD